MAKIFIDGKEGTTGLKIADRFALRSDIELLILPEELRKDVSARAEMINSSDITFLCLPDAAAREAVLLANSNVRIIDASTAHRTESGWAYGFPELGEKFRNAIKHGNRVAVPGCHAGGFLSIVYPLRAANIMPADYPLVCHSLTGYSGGGKKMIAEYENSNGNLASPRQYGIGQTHKHLKEMTAIAELTSPPIFNPIVAGFYSGMEVTVPLIPRYLNGITLEEVYNVFAEHYKNSALIKVEKMAESYPDGFIPADALRGSNTMKILVGGNDERILVISLFDNLGKGASGAAVQCMNIMLGLDETTGLI